MKRWIATVIIGALALMGTACVPPKPNTNTNPPAQCQEDQACWNCHTMGNLICGKP